MRETSFDPETGAQLTAMLEREYDTQDSSGSVISTIEMADAVYARCLRPKSSVPKEIYYAAIMELRQMARQICARQEVRDEDDESQGYLPFMFQRRYPRKSAGDSQYVLFEHMTYEDFTENAMRLAAAGEAFKRHSQELIKHRDLLVHSGRLKPSIDAAEDFPQQ